MTDSIAKVIEEMRALSRTDAGASEFGARRMKEWADRLAALDGWRPIADIPEKGIPAPVILYWPATGRARGHNSNTLSEMIRVDFVGSTPSRKPTHWMPLPTPPKETP